MIEWIRFEDRMPPMEKKVLGWSDLYDCPFILRFKPCGYMIICEIRGGSDEVFNYFFWGLDDEYEFTHWMELPDPPAPPKD